MKRVILWWVPAVLAATLAAAAGCASLATPEAPSSGSPTTGGGVAANVSQQVKDGGQLYVDLACVRCHAPQGVGGIPNRLNVGGDSTIPPLDNAYRDETEQFRTAVQITQVLDEGGIVSKKPGVINMPSWKGVINDGPGRRRSRLHPRRPPEHRRQLRPRSGQGGGHLQCVRLPLLSRAGGAQRLTAAGAESED